jgi:hypothetical protein
MSSDESNLSSSMIKSSKQDESTDSESNIKQSNSNYAELIKKIDRCKKQSSNETKPPKLNRKQIEMCITRIKNDKYRVDEHLTERKPKLKINQDRVNRLKTLNEIERIKNEQLLKVNRYGEELIGSAEPNRELERDREQMIYYKHKCNLITVNQTNKNFDQHEIDFCDSLMLIADLARTLPRINIDWNSIRN